MGVHAGSMRPKEKALAMLKSAACAFWGLKSAQQKGAREEDARTNCQTEFLSVPARRFIKPMA